jgi:SAM-dependent methyltransferase
MDKSLYTKFYEVENVHWWFVARRFIVEEILARQLHLPPGATVLDVGCGTGGVAACLAKRYQVFGTDTSPLAVDFCRKRGLKNIHCGTLDDAPFSENQFEAILLLDVIEHIDNDENVLRQVWRLLRPGGFAVITVPAYNWLWSRHDDLNNHKRRYTASTLRAPIERAGFRIRKLSYFNCILFPLALVERLVLKALGSSPADGLTIPFGPLNTFFKWLFELERFPLRKMRLPFGLSLIVVAKRPS